MNPRSLIWVAALASTAIPLPAPHTDTFAPRQAIATQTAHAPESSAAPDATALAVPFGVGERINYDVKYLGARVGRAAMEVVKIEEIRGRPAWNVQLRISGSALLGLIKLNSVFESWMDTATLNSLRYFSDQETNGKDRERLYDIYPERSQFKLRWTPDTIPEMESVSDPLDDASFLYFIRTTPLEVGKTYQYHRYFRPDRNPVIVKVVAREEVRTPIAKFPAIVIEPIIKTSGIFSEGGKAKIWLSDDAARIVLKIETSAPVGSATLEMTGYTPPKR